MNHELKIWPEYYKAINDKIKKFEIRKNDRNFKVGDQIVLREFEPCKECNGSGKIKTENSVGDLIEGTDSFKECNCGKNHGKYTGNGCAVSIDYIVEGGQFGIEKGYCVMSITVTASRKSYK